jgi:hypothetical protein
MKTRVLVLALLASTLHAQESGLDAYRRGEQALKEGRPAEALAAYRRAVAVYPQIASAWGGVAKAAVAAGEPAAALQALERVAAIGALPEPHAATLLALPASPAREALAGRFAENARPLNRSRVFAALPERDLIAESLDLDPRDGSAYVGSLHLRKILRVAPDGAVSDFVAPARDGLWSVLGIKIDPVRRELWANSCNVGANPPMKPAEPATVGRSAVYRFALDDGRLIRRYAPEAKLCFNDLAFAGGRVYLTTGGDGVWVVDPEAHTLTKAMETPGLMLNGIAADPAGHVFLADALQGVLRFDPAAGTAAPLPVPEGASLAGIDGLYVHRGALVGIQNGLRGVPPRVLRAALAPDGIAVTGFEVLERAHPLHDVPTCGAVAGDRLVYVANSQLDAFTDGAIWPAERLHRTYLLELDLPR